MSLTFITLSIQRFAILHVSREHWLFIACGFMSTCSCLVVRQHRVKVLMDVVKGVCVDRREEKRREEKRREEKRGFHNSSES